MSKYYVRRQSATAWRDEDRAMSTETATFEDRNAAMQWLVDTILRDGQIRHTAHWKQAGPIVELVSTTTASKTVEVDGISYVFSQR